MFFNIILFYGLVSVCCANQYYGGGGGDGRMDSKQYFNLPKSNSPMVSKQLFELLPIHQDPPVEQVFNLFSGDLPVKLVFRSRSSPITIQQVHLASSPMKVQETSSEDVPHLVRHKVLRPVVQEVREIIQPMRTITQEIRPVLEEVHTVVAKKDVDGHHSGPKSQAKHVNKGRQYTPDNVYQPQPSPYLNEKRLKQLVYSSNSMESPSNMNMLVTLNKSPLYVDEQYLSNLYRSKDGKTPAIHSRGTRRQ